MEIFPTEIWKIIIDYMPCEAAIGFCLITRKVPLLYRNLRTTIDVPVEVASGIYRQYRSLKDLIFNGFISVHRLLVLAIKRGDNSAYGRLIKQIDPFRDTATYSFNLLNSIKENGIKQDKSVLLSEIVNDMEKQRVKILDRIAAGESIEDLQYDIEWGKTYKRKEYMFFERWGTHEKVDVTYTINHGVRSRPYSSFGTITLQQLQMLPWSLKTMLKIFKWHRWDLWEAIKGQVQDEHWVGETTKTDWMSIRALNIVWEHRLELLTDSEFLYPPLCFYSFCDANDLEPYIKSLYGHELESVLRLKNMEAYIDTFDVVEERFGNSGVSIEDNKIVCPNSGESGNIRALIRALNK